jgi:heme exporter protein C
MLRPLIVMALGAALLFVVLLLAAMRNEIHRRRLRTLRLAEAAAAA